MRFWLAAQVCALATLMSAPAQAYEFEVHARTVAQASSLRSFRYLGPDVLLSRRRFSQLLSLDVWGIGQPRPDWRRHQQRLQTGPRLSISTSLRLDHDFGDYGAGQIALDNRLYDAVDLIPELEAETLALDVWWAYLSAERLAGGWLDAHIGRQLEVDAFEFWSMDGVRVVSRLPGHMVVEAFGGLRVRDSSPLGPVALELDGTASGECQEYIEGVVPGSGAWRPIDLDRAFQNDAFANDLDRCPQRESRMPTMGGTVSYQRGRQLSADVSYRRSVSKSPGLIGPADRLQNEDLGYYPNDFGQAPSWGVNEEHITASVRTASPTARPGTVPRLRPSGHAAIRYSLLHGLIDQALLGMRLGMAQHAISAEVYHSTPTFDGDSIFNVFSSRPYTDGRLTWDIGGVSSRWSGFVRTWLRRFSSEDPSSDPLAGGLQAGGRYRHATGRQMRVDLFHDDGYGGRRTGGHGVMRWRIGQDTLLTSRASLIHFRDDVQASLHGWSVGVATGGTYVFSRGVAVSLLAEENLNRLHRSQFSLFAVFDLAFAPDL